MFILYVHIVIKDHTMWLVDIWVQLVFNLEEMWSTKKMFENIIRKNQASRLETKFDFNYKNQENTTFKKIGLLKI
jgi:hypothetical protein